MIEKAVYEQMYQYFSSLMIFHPNMHSFRRHRSTQTALLSLYDKLVRAAANGKVNGVVLLDFSAAFNLVEPEMINK